MNINRSDRTLQRDESIKHVNDAINKIEVIKKNLERKNEEIPSLKEIEELFANIYYILEKKQSELKNDIKEFKLILDEIKRSQVKILSKKTEIIYETIKANLPKGMKLDPLNGDIKNCVL